MYGTEGLSDVSSTVMTEDVVVVDDDEEDEEGDWVALPDSVVCPSGRLIIKFRVVFVSI